MLCSSHNNLKNIFVFVFLLCSVFSTAAATSPAVIDSILRIPGGTKAIPASGFIDRTDIRKVVFESPCVLTKIGDYAFMGCSSLREIDLPSSLRTIGEGAFRECESLSSVKIPAGVAKLPKYTFSWCSSLSRIELPNSLIDIGSGCFSYCINLTDLKLPASLRHIGANAFSFCKRLEHIEVPASVTELESYAFCDCSSLLSAVLPANAHLLGELIFEGCRELRSITCASLQPPPFDCNSTLFDDNEQFMYRKCVLMVRSDALSSFEKAHGWKLFTDIRPIIK